MVKIGIIPNFMPRYFENLIQWINILMPDLYSALSTIIKSLMIYYVSNFNVWHLFFENTCSIIIINVSDGPFFKQNFFSNFMLRKFLCSDLDSSQLKPLRKYTLVSELNICCPFVVVAPLYRIDILRSKFNNFQSSKYFTVLLNIDCS